MTEQDRLAEIKNMIANAKVSEHQYEAQRLDRVKAIQAINWLIAEVERLRDIDKHLPLLVNDTLERAAVIAEGPLSFDMGKDDYPSAIAAAIRAEAAKGVAQ